VFSGFRVQGSGFRYFQGSRFRVQGLGIFRVQGSGFRYFRGSEFGVEGLGWIPGLRCSGSSRLGASSAPGACILLQVLEFRIWGLGFGV